MAPVIVGLLGLGAVAGMWIWNPQGGPTMCPLKALTGWDCPFCGGLRGTHDLLHGQVGDALNQNVLLLVYLGALATTWLVWIRGAAAESSNAAGPGRRPKPWMWWTLGVGLLVFTVVRNLPGVGFLPSGLN